MSIRLWPQDFERKDHITKAEKALLSVEGVEKVEIDLASGTTIITGKATIEDVKNAIHSIGFTIKE